MPRFATIAGDIFFTAGDGTPMQVPWGRVEVELSSGSATLSWTGDPGVTCTAVTPLESFDEQVRAGKIVLER